MDRPELTHASRSEHLLSIRPNSMRYAAGQSPAIGLSGPAADIALLMPPYQPRTARPIRNGSNSSWERPQGSVFAGEPKATWAISDLSYRGCPDANDSSPADKKPRSCPDLLRLNILILLRCELQAPERKIIQCQFWQGFVSLKIAPVSNSPWSNSPTLGRR